MRGIDMGDIFYNKTVTLYNKVVDDVMGTETWYPTVLKNVRLLVKKGENVSKSGRDSADTTTLFVKFDILSCGKKTYLPSKKWQNAPDKQKYFTFTSQEDFFVEGDTSMESILTEGCFQHMKDSYDNCYMVTNVDRFELIPHLEVGGA